MQVVRARVVVQGAGAVSKQEPHLCDAADGHGIGALEVVGELFEGNGGLEDLVPTDRRGGIVGVVWALGFAQDAVDRTRELAAGGRAD